MVKGAVARDVYLTRGRWRDLMDPTLVFEGGQWLRGLDAPLNKLPCFQRMIDVEAEPVVVLPLGLEAAL